MRTKRRRLYNWYSPNEKFRKVTIWFIKAKWTSRGVSEFFKYYYKKRENG